MYFSTSRTPRPGHVRPLAACVAAIAALTTPAIVLGAAVTNCNDVGPNSLRAGIASAMSGDTIDLSHLSCSTITLEDLQIVIPQNDLTILGPRGHVTIAHDGNYARVLNHQGTGTLKLENINVTLGDPYNPTYYVNGGCIYSNGSVYLKNSNVTYCSATSGSGYSAKGGGIFTSGDLSLINSTIAGNVAGSPQTFEGEGGAAHVGGAFTAVTSSIRNNSAKGSYSSFHGGVGVYGGFSISGSTLSGNSANVVGGLAAFGFSGGNILDNSTISGNHGGYRLGGTYLAVSTTIRNSTIAFNSAGSGKVQSVYQSPGLVVSGFGGNTTLSMESSIVSNNTYNSNGTTIENDFSQQTANGGAVTVTGQRNLIVASLDTFPPQFVTVQSCPLLGPLRNNGGLTLTHALLSHSPAIDAGSNLCNSNTISAARRMSAQMGLLSHSQIWARTKCRGKTSSSTRDLTAVSRLQ